MSFLGSKKAKILVIAAIVVVAGAGVLKLVAARSLDSTAISRGVPLFETQRGPLAIAVSVAGTIKAREQIILRNEVEGNTTILSIVPEGNEVQQGDLLVELDSANMLDEKIEQEIRVKNAEADYIGAREALEVTKSQAQSDVDQARLAYQFAQEDLKKYIEGDYPMQLKTRETEITLAEGEAKRAEALLAGSRRLAEKNFITPTELEADQLDALRRNLNLELARDQKSLLETYEYERQVTQLESDVKQAEMALERAERKAKADVIQAEARLEAIESTYNQEKGKLEKVITQLEKTKIYAPSDGLVVYATTGRGRGGWRGDNDQPLEEGRSVREREELIYLPTTGSFNAEVQVHEANRSKVSPGLPVRITVDAVPGKTFFGVVSSVAPLPNAQTSWMNPDLKVYDTDIEINGNNVEGLRTGQSCLAEIVVDSYEDVTYVPIQAVVMIEGEHYVYVAQNGTQVQRKVEVGLDNNRMIHVKNGLDAGEKVLLEPPLAQSERSNEVATAIDSEFQEFADQTNRDRENGVGPGGRPRQGGPGGPGGPGSPGGSRGGGEEGGFQSRGGPGGGGPGGWQNMSEEDRQRMRERFENMSEEERQQMRERFRGGGGSGGPGGGDPGGGRQGGGGPGGGGGGGSR